MSNRAAPLALYSLVHRLATLSTPLKAQDAVLSVRALHVLRPYAPTDIQAICAKAAFSIAVAPPQDVQPAVVVDTVNSMTALHATVLSSSSSAGVTMQSRLCGRFLDLNRRSTPNKTLHKACVVLMKVALPTSAAIDTRVTNYVLRLVHERLRESESAIGDGDALLPLAYLALFPYTSMCSRDAFLASAGVLDKPSLQTLLVCAEAVVRSDNHRPVDRLRGLDALQALHLAPVLALIDEAAKAPEWVATASPTLLSRWKAVRQRFLSVSLVCHVRMADGIAFVSRFSDLVHADAPLFAQLMRVVPEDSPQRQMVHSARDLSALLTSFAHVPAKATRSATLDSTLTRLLTRTMRYVTEKLELEAIDSAAEEKQANVLTDCAILVSNCWQAYQANGGEDLVLEPKLCALTREPRCLSTLVCTPGAAYATLLSIGALYSSRSSPNAATPSPSPSDERRKELASTAAALWRSCRSDTVRTLPARMEAAFVFVACSMLSHDVGAHMSTEGQHGDHDGDTAVPCRELWCEVSDQFAVSGTSDDMAVLAVRDFRQSSEVGLLLDGLGKLLRCHTVNATLLDRVVEPKVLNGLCRLGVAAIHASIGGQKLALDTPWRPLTYLRDVTVSHLSLTAQAHAAFRVCTLALAKRRALPVADMLKVFAALSGTDLHGLSTRDGAVGATGLVPMDRNVRGVLDAVCSHHIYMDEESFFRLCPRAALLWRCAEAARRCGAEIKLEDDEDSFLTAHRRSATGVLDAVPFLLDVSFLTQPSVLAWLTPCDAAHLLRLVSESIPFKSDTQTTVRGDKIDADLPQSVDASVRETLDRLASPVKTLVELALTRNDEPGTDLGTDFWRLVYLLNANRFSHASQELFPLEVVRDIVLEVISFCDAAIATEHVVCAYVGALANALLESCALTRLRGDTQLMQTVRVRLLEVRTVLAAQPSVEDQKTALKLDVFLS